MAIELLARPMASTYSPEPRGNAALRLRVEVGIRGPGGREQVARALSDLVRDALCISGADVTGGPIAHLVDALEFPVAAATETAIDTLMTELEDILALVPDADLEVWERVRLRAELGSE